MTLDIDAIEARAAKATKGPWISEFACVGVKHPQGGQATIVTAPHETPQDRANCDFIAAARQDIPALIAEGRRLREALEEIDKQNEVNKEYARREWPKDNPLPPLFLRQTMTVN